MQNKGVNICCLSETRLPEEGQKTVQNPKGDGIKMFHTGTVNKGLYGVGFAVDTKTSNCVREWMPISDRIAKLRLGAKPRDIILFSVYAPIKTIFMTV